MQCEFIFVLHVWSLLLFKVCSIVLPKNGSEIIVAAGKVHDVVLSCPYRLEPGDKNGLVVSWYLEGTPRTIYQWIPFSRPETLGFLKDHIDKTYNVSADDFYKYRNLRLFNPTTKFSGKYMCKVSSFIDEKVHHISLLVYSHPSDFEITVASADDKDLTVRCSVYSAYPEPVLQLFKSKNNKRIPVSNGKIKSFWSEGVYNVTLETVMHQQKLGAVAEFECRMNIPKTNITMKKVIQFLNGKIQTYTESLPSTHYDISRANHMNLLLQPISVFIFTLPKLL